MTEPRITVAVVALDEAENLRTLLPQLGWASEIVVVDGGSSDDTVAVAQACGASVIERPFDDFASQRNAALAASHGEWVFYIDADERPTPRLVAEVRRRIITERCAGYRVPIRSRIFNRRFRFSGTQDDRPLRLVRRDSGRWEGRVHETFAICGAVGCLEAFLEHRTMPTVGAFLAKMQRYTTLAAEQRRQRGERPRLRDFWLRPSLEVFRRLVWKHGWLDGPQGCAFCLLSGYSEWVLARKYHRLSRASKPLRRSTTIARLLALGDVA